MQGFLSKPQVDIIIPSYNRRELLKRAVQSVQNQTYKNWSLLIVDDGSTDGTSEECFGDGVQILKLKKNFGVSFARNQGVLHTKGDWLAFLDSDDEWLPEKLEKQMEYAKAHPECPLIHCDEIWMKKGQLLNQKKKHKKQGGRIFSSCVRLCCISPSAVLLKRSVFDSPTLFREDFPVCEDYELWLRISSRYDVGFLKEALLIKHGGHEDQLSRKYFGMDYWRLKALYPYLEEESLFLEERRLVRKILLQKSEILLKGYEKHKNFKDKEEVEAIYNQARETGKSL